jgi:hypothetical protein
MTLQVSGCAVVYFAANDSVLAVAVLEFHTKVHCLFEARLYSSAETEAVSANQRPIVLPSSPHFAKPFCWWLFFSVIVVQILR